LRRRMTNDRTLSISNWSDSLEGAITFMSWVRVLTSIVTGVTYPSRVPLNTTGLWRRHRVLANRLFASGIAPAKRLSVLVELGGLEITLWGLTWALEAKRFRGAETGRRPISKEGRKTEV